MLCYVKLGAPDVVMTLAKDAAFIVSVTFTELLLSCLLPETDLR